MTAANNRLFVDAVIRRYRTGMLAVLALGADDEYAMIDNTIVRVHQHSAGAQKEPTKTRRLEKAKVARVPKSMFWYDNVLYLMYVGAVILRIFLSIGHVNTERATGDMVPMPENSRRLVGLTAQIVSTYLATNEVAADALPGLILGIRQWLADLGRTTPERSEILQPSALGSRSLPIIWSAWHAGHR